MPDYAGFVKGFGMGSRGISQARVILGGPKDRDGRKP